MLHMLRVTADIEPGFVLLSNKSCVEKEMKKSSRPFFTLLLAVGAMLHASVGAETRSSEATTEREQRRAELRATVRNQHNAQAHKQLAPRNLSPQERDELRQQLRRQQLPGSREP